LSEIAINCGFADQAHFSRQFRRTMGDTPNTWRRERAPRLFARQEIRV
jgi:AraC family transcriptional regulator